MDGLDNVLLIEENDCLNSINEDTNKGKTYILEGICIQTGIKNKNGRIYPQELVRREVNRYINEKVNSGKAIGELNHPVGPGSGVVNYERTTHRYTSLKEDGLNWIGRAVVAHKTPVGSVVAGLMDAGVTMGTSSRATGSVKLQEGIKYVTALNLITPGDIVSDPSAPDAYLTGIMENREWVYANGLLVEMEYPIKEKINKMAANKQLTKENMATLFESLFREIRVKR